MITYLTFFDPKIPQISICCTMSLMGRSIIGALMPIKLHRVSEPGRKVRHVRAAVAESTVVEMDRKKDEVNVGSELRGWVVSAFEALKSVVDQKRRDLGGHHIELFIENGMTNCRFFTIMSVAGSLIGSILCFVEGCFFVMESFLKYNHNMRQSSSKEVEVVHHLIEALDLFLVGTALYSFGVGTYMMFLGKGETRQCKEILPSFGLFENKQLRSIVVMRTVSEAKMKIGHSMMMILQAGVLEKFKNVPVTSALDLACFSGAILVSSLSIFLLSRISQRNKHKKNCEMG